MLSPHGSQDACLQLQAYITLTVSHPIKERKLLQNLWQSYERRVKLALGHVLISELVTEVDEWWVIGWTWIIWPSLSQSQWWGDEHRDWPDLHLTVITVSGAWEFLVKLQVFEMDFSLKGQGLVSKEWRCPGHHLGVLKSLYEEGPVLFFFVSFSWPKP